MTLSRPHQIVEELGASALVAVLEEVWGEIRRRHPDVPPVIVTVGSGSLGARPGKLRLGHYAAARWRPAVPDVDAVAIAELFVGGEGLAHGPVDVLGTLLHEAAHGVAVTREVKDTSRAGAYHNARFRGLGEELGLHIERDAAIGWSLTSVPDVTAAAYAAEVGQLRVAIVPCARPSTTASLQPRGVAARGEGDAAGVDDGDEAAGAGSRSAPTYVCGCASPRRLRMAPSVYELGGVLCGAGGQPFIAAH